MLNKFSARLCVGFMISFLGINSAIAASKASSPADAGCSTIIDLASVSSSARGGTIIWKSNWSKKLNRELTFGEGNHSQKGAAFLVLSKSGKAPKVTNIPILDANGTQIANMRRYPRCSYVIVQGKRVFACGLHERWYLKTGSGQKIPGLASLATNSGGSNSILIPLAGSSCAKIGDVYSNREQS